MGKAFSEAEKVLINAKIKSKGAELFAKFGLKKTTVDDIAKETGIGRGTFYLFYESKEDFFLGLIEETERRVKDDIILKILSSTTPIGETFKEFIKDAFLILEKNPLLRNILGNKEEFEFLLRTLPPQRLHSFLNHDNQIVLEVLAVLEEKGITLPIKSLTFSGMLRGVYLLSLHKNLIGVEVYPEIIEFLADSVARNLLKKR
jgi:AcrR family transcriptional regulator